MNSEPIALRHLRLTTRLLDYKRISDQIVKKYIYKTQGIR